MVYCYLSLRNPIAQQELPACVASWNYPIAVHPYQRLHTARCYSSFTLHLTAFAQVGKLYFLKAYVNLVDGILLVAVKPEYSYPVIALVVEVC